MTMTEALAALSTRVANQGTAIEAAITLMGALSAELAAAKGDPAAVQAIIDQVDAQNAALVGATAANTPPVV